MNPQEPQTSHLSLSAPESRGQGWLASRLLRRQVVNASTLEPVGRVADVAIDPERCRVVGLIISRNAPAAPAPAGGGLIAVVRRALRRQHDTGIVPSDHIVALNGDVVMVDQDPVRSVPLRSSGHEARLCEVCELTILTYQGICLGSLADVLLDERGTAVTGYVVTPTRHAEMVLQPLDLLLPEPEDAKRSAPPQTASETDASETLAAAEPPEASPEPPVSPDTHLRVIPASPRVRISESLILVVEEVEPIPQDVVTITSQPVKDRAGVQEHQSQEQPARYNGFNRHGETHRPSH